MPERLLHFFKRRPRPTWLAGLIVLFPGGQGAQPTTDNTLTVIIVLIAIFGPLVLGAGAGLVLWLISKAAPPAVIGAEAEQPRPPREALPPGVHLPPPSLRPLILALGMTLASIGIITRNIAIPINLNITLPIVLVPISLNVALPIVLVLGLLVTFVGLIGWVRDDFRAADHR